MTRTIKREPFSISIPNDQSGFFNLIGFKGLCDNQNDVAIDQTTFAESENVYVDSNDCLSSRPPLKFTDGEAHILKEWHFGPYGLRLYNFIVDENNKIVTNIEDAKYSLFILRCYTHWSYEGVINGHITYSKYAWRMSIEGYDYTRMPKIVMKQIEDKIFIWVASRDFICLNTAGYRINTGEVLPYFTDAKPFLYLPIKKLITNGLESDLESSNFLTNSYRKRYIQSALSGIDFHKLQGKNLEVTLTNGQGSQYLYDINVTKNSDKMLIYPVSPVGEGYEIDVVQGLRATVYLRYDKTTHDTEISFNGKLYQALPTLTNIIGTPQLTKDGLWVIAFTTTGLAKCKLVAEETSDFTDNSEIMVWQVEPYLRRAIRDGLPVYLNTIDSTFTPTGYFETAYNFAYIIKGPDIYENDTKTNKQYCYAEWIGEQGKTYWGNMQLTDSLELASDDAKTFFKYTPTSTSFPDVGPLVSILGRDINIVNNINDRLLAFDLNSRSRFEIKNNDFVGVTEIQSYAGKSFVYNTNPLAGAINAGYIHKLSADGKKLAFGTITSGDIVYFGDKPLGLGITPNYRNIVSYKPGDYIISNTTTGENPPIPTIFVCIRESIDNAPPTTIMDNDYWKCVGTCSVFTYTRTDKEGKVTGIYHSYTDAAVSELANVPGMSIFRESTNRYIITNTTGGAIKPNDTISLTPYNANIIYNDAEMTEIFGVFPKGTTSSGVIDTSPVTWNLVLTDGRSAPSKEFDGIAAIKFLDNPSIVTKSNKFMITNAVGSVKNMDSIILQPIMSYSDIKYPIRIAYRTATMSRFFQIAYNRTTNRISQDSLFSSSNIANIFKISSNGTQVLTDKYLLIYPDIGDNEFVLIPVTGTDVRPLFVGNYVYYYIDGTIWTSAINADDTLELDEFVDTNGKMAILNDEIPEYFAELEEIYMSFVSVNEGRNLLQITQTKRDERKLLTQETADFLLYLPKKNEQVLANKITNLHPLYEKVVGVFTDKEIYYVNTITLNDGTITYSKPIKSKLPVGCKDDSDIVTAMNGQAILFTTPRGVAALSPQDFVATTEQTITYLSAGIENTYNDFYEKYVPNMNIVKGVEEQWYRPDKPSIKIAIYRYWILFYKYCGRDILMFDMRYNTWWQLKTQYPIRGMYAADDLTLLLELDESLLDGDRQMIVPPLYGVSFLFSDRKKYKKYKDDVVVGTYNGDVQIKREHGYDGMSGFIGTRYIKNFATNNIEWKFKSQKLHFNQPNNYKLIKAINVSARGDDTAVAELSTIVYRNYYHPEKTDTIELKVNDIRTFIKRMNLMHVVYFQFKMASDNTQEYPVPLELNSLSVKYEVKEKVR